MMVSAYDGIGDSAPHAAERMLEGTKLVERVAFVIDSKWEKEATSLMRLFELGNTPIKHFAATTRCCFPAADPHTRRLRGEGA